MAQKKKSDPKVQALKVPPHSIDAEQSVLGGLLMDNRAWDLIADHLSEIDFYRQEHRSIFSAITDLAARQSPFDLLTLTEILKTHNTLESVGGEAYLYELAARVPSVANITAYADIVRERSVLRRLIEAAQDIANAAFNPEQRTSAELLDEAEGKVFAIAETGSHRAEPMKSSQIMAKAFERLSELQNASGHITGVSTGFTKLDEMTSGWQAGDLIIIAARPSMGKTAFSMNLAEEVVIRQKKPALIFSMEMSSEQLALRLISSLGAIDQHKVRTARMSPTEWGRVASTVSLISQAPLYIDDTPGLTPGEVRARARRLMRQCGGELGLIVVDYLQLMQVAGMAENRTQEVSQISRALKNLARELKVPVIALSQLNRSLEQRADRRPVMSDLRESGAIEQDADVIAFIYRDEVYNENSTEKGKAEIIISKQRNGPIGKVHLSFLGHYTRFENLEEGYYMYEADQTTGHISKPPPPPTKSSHKNTSAISSEYVGDDSENF